MSFTISKILWLFLQPSNALLLFLLLSALLAAAGWRGGRPLMAAATGALSFVSLLPVGQWLLLPLESRLSSPVELPKEIDGAIVLGGGFDGRTAALPNRVELSSAADRVTALIALGRRYPDAKLVYSGGVGALLGERTPGAEQAKAFYQQQGFDLKRIVFEGKSRNTWENAVYSRDLVKPAPDETWLLVTSASHMPRAVGVFRKLDWNVTPYPVDFHVVNAGDQLAYAFDPTVDVAARLGELDLAAKEWVGLLAYWLMGRTAALSPASALGASAQTAAAT
jgi:uncharacterized SAM-binding protein YcdF (DUF218 family)